MTENERKTEKVKKVFLKNQISSKEQFLFHWKKSDARSINKCPIAYYCWAKQNALRPDMPKYGIGKGKKKNTVSSQKAICSSYEAELHSQPLLGTAHGVYI